MGAAPGSAGGVPGGAGPERDRPAAPAERPVRAQQGRGPEAGEGRRCRRNPEPPLVATPRANCVSGGKREPGIQGRIPAGAADNGLSCNTTLIGRAGQLGRVQGPPLRGPRRPRVRLLRHRAAVPDQRASALDGTSGGVAVLDMSNPAKPVRDGQADRAAHAQPARVAGAEHQARPAGGGAGQPLDLPRPGVDLRRQPGLPQAGAPVHLLVARLGHESGFSEDGKTFYATSHRHESISAIDVTDPKHPKNIWQGAITSHGMSLSPDGNRAYLADPGGELVTLDTSEIQARKPNPQAREISRLTWKSASIPQNALPFTDGGKPYILEFDEYTAGTTGGGDAGRGGRGPHHRHVRRAQAAGDRQAAPAGQPGGRPRGGTQRSRRPRAPSRATPRTTATSTRAWTRRSWRARSSPPACACSTSPS